VNDSELNDLLHRARVPERPDAQWTELQEDTVRRLTDVATSGQSAANRSPDQMAALCRDAATERWGRIRWWPTLIGGATACVLFIFAFNHWHTGRVEPSRDLADARKLFSELNALFPNQLEAVVFDGSTPRLVLGEQAYKGTPLFVRLCSAQGCQRVITFSGQRVPLNGESCEVLVDARGHVIVTGERFAWSSGDGATTGGYRIEAATL
jgi:hypothetical protein